MATNIVRKGKCVGFGARESRESARHQPPSWGHIELTLLKLAEAAARRVASTSGQLAKTETNIELDLWTGVL